MRMKPKKLTLLTLVKLFNAIKKRADSAVGNYLYKGLRIQVSKYNLSGSQRVSELYHRRRNNGLCILCGRPVAKVNPRTGKLYRLCAVHRRHVK